MPSAWFSRWIDCHHQGQSSCRPRVVSVMGSRRPRLPGDWGLCVVLCAVCKRACMCVSVWFGCGLLCLRVRMCVLCAERGVGWLPDLAVRQCGGVTGGPDALRGPCHLAARDTIPSASLKVFLPQSLLQVRNWTSSVLCSPADLPPKGFSNQIALVARGNCTFYEKVRLAQGSGARGLLIVSKEALVRPPGLLGILGPWGRDRVRV